MATYTSTWTSTENTKWTHGSTTLTGEVISSKTNTELVNWTYNNEATIVYLKYDAYKLVQDQKLYIIIVFQLRHNGGSQHPYVNLRATFNSDYIQVKTTQYYWNNGNYGDKFYMMYTMDLSESSITRTLTFASSANDNSLSNLFSSDITIPAYTTHTITCNSQDDNSTTTAISGKANTQVNLPDRNQYTKSDVKSSTYCEVLFNPGVGAISSASAFSYPSYKYTPYTAGNWTQNANGTGTNYGIGKITLSGNFNVYLQWNAGTAYYESITCPAKPAAKDGYTFNGWKLSGQTNLYQPNTTFQPSASTSANSTITFTGDWTASNYTVIYHPNTDDLNPLDTISVSHVIGTQNASTFTAGKDGDNHDISNTWQITGQTINGWSTSPTNASGSTYYQPNATITHASTTPLHLYAIWGSSGAYIWQKYEIWICVPNPNQS